MMLSKDFVALVFIALGIASPFAWYFMHAWLQDFAYRVPINGWLFVLAGLTAMAVALLTISFQAIKAATASPVKAIKNE